MNYIIYVADVETTGLDSRKHDIIEVSLLRLSDNVQKTWCIKPITENIDPGALRINGHKIEDLKHQTIEGKERYLEASKVIIDIENWILEDGIPAENRVLCGQNVAFDKDMLTQLWVKCDSGDSFPFGRRTLDTMTIQFFEDWCQGKMAEGYSLANLTKRYGITNSKAHTAEADTLATKLVFEKQVEFFKKVLKC